ALLIVAWRAPKPLAALALGSIVVVAAPDWHGHYSLLLVPPVVVGASGIWNEVRRRQFERRAQVVAEPTHRSREAEDAILDEYLGRSRLEVARYGFSVVAIRTG